MPDRAAHLLQAERNEAFLTRINTPDMPYREWVVTVWFYICVQYVDAFLTEKGHRQVADHPDRFAKMQLHQETRSIFEDYEMLYKDRKEARYQTTQYTSADLQSIEQLYLKIRRHLRQALGLPG